MMPTEHSYDNQALWLPSSHKCHGVNRKIQILTFTKFVSVMNLTQAIQVKYLKLLYKIIREHTSVTKVLKWCTNKMIQINSYNI